MESLESVLKRCKVVMDGHFVLSGDLRLHTGRYFEKANLYKADTSVLVDLCWDLARKLRASIGEQIDLVVSPAPMGVVLAHRVAERLGEIYQNGARAVFTEKEGVRQVLGRGFYEDVVASRGILVLDDVTTTGLTIRKIAEEIRRVGGRIVATETVCNRGNVTPDNIYGLPLISLLRIFLKTWREEDCPLCKKAVPVTASVGRGAEFLSEHPEYPSK